MPAAEPAHSRRSAWKVLCMAGLGSHWRILPPAFCSRKPHLPHHRLRRVATPEGSARRL